MTSPESPRAECGGEGLTGRGPRRSSCWRARYPHPAARLLGVSSPRPAPTPPETLSSAGKAGGWALGSGRALAALPRPHSPVYAADKDRFTTEEGPLPPRHKEPPRVNAGSGDELQGHHVPSRLTQDAWPHRRPWRPRGSDSGKETAARAQEAWGGGEGELQALFLQEKPKAMRFRSILTGHLEGRGPPISSSYTKP